ncbi:chemotaxis protein CheW, partial [bacterium]|nr:chemotaxis protein CheW [bacterium]
NIRDDGRGINHAAVLSRARERGLVAPGAELAPDEIEDLLFEPGFSTAATVTDISGRGVGLDVVRRNIQGLGGRVSVSSSPGSGTCFTMTLPLTLAVMDGMIVVVGGEKFVIPTTNIIESMRPDREQVNRLPSGDELVEVRGDYLPLLYIARAFGIEEAVDDPSRGLVVLAETERKGKVGLVVDELLGQQQVVIKSLEDNYDPVPGISAATILGNGLVAPILDIESLQSMSQISTAPPTGLAAAMADNVRRPDMIASIEEPERNQWT